MREGNGPVEATKRDSLRLLGSVGEPINPEAWLWYYNTVGEGSLPHCRHLVADRDRGYSYLTTARRYTSEAGLCNAPFFWNYTANCRC